MDNQRLITWGLFAFLAFMTWQAWMRDYGPQRDPRDDTPAGAETADAPADELGDLVVPGDDLPSVKPASEPASSPSAAETEPAESRIVVVRTDVFELQIDTRGGTIRHAAMLQYPVHKDRPDDKVVLLDTAEANLGLIRSWLRNTEDPASAPGADAVYETPDTEYVLDSGDELIVPLTWRSASGVTVEKRFVFRRGEYAIGLEQRVHNGTTSEWRGDQVTQIVRRSFEKERSMFDPETFSFDGPQVYDGDKAEKLERDDLLDDGPFSFTSEDGWAASIQHHFLTAVVPAAQTRNIFQLSLSGNRLTTSVIGAPEVVAPGGSAQFARTLFVGPKLQDQLKAVHPKLALSVDYGLLTPLSAPMFWLLSWVNGFVGNWGWAIIIVTLLIKLAFYKLTQTSGRSMAKLRELQPRMKALQDRYKDDRQALSQAMMELYKREKVNPAAGCLPILIQMPFFLAFYWVLVESVEMRQAPFALWITDLSERDPYFILPLIMGAAMLFQQKLNPAPADPVQARVMQIMPVIFTVFFAFFPAGLVLYWVTNTLLSIAQQWRINKVVHAEAQARKAGKPKKGKKGEGDQDA
jgi:YidC/Oxa1 family membrane protein insertase